ncbi:MAG: energy transducer TonB [Sulfuricella sp.]
MPPAERKEPGRKWAITLAVLVHLIFAAVLVFGVNWQTKEASPVMAELWNSLPTSAPKPAPKPEPQPAPQPEPEPKPQPKPVPKPEPRMALKMEPRMEPKPVKADIEFKEKEKEKKRKEEEKKKAETEKKLKELALKEQRAMLEAEQVALSKQHEAAEVARLQAAAQAATAQARLMNDAIGRISSHIRRFVVMPPDMVGNPQAEFEVSLIPTGEVLNVKLSRSSGNPAYDNAVERAIRKASPLPLPTDPALVGRFRELKLKFRPNE